MTQHESKRYEVRYGHHPSSFIQVTFLAPYTLRRVWQMIAKDGYVMDDTETVVVPLHQIISLRRLG